MLRVVCCYVPGMLRPATEKALLAFIGPGWFRGATPEVPPDAAFTIEYEPLAPDDQFIYGKTIQRLWRECLERSEDLCLVEQDVEIGPSTLYDFRACLHWYCGCPYSWLTDSGVALGCTRFRHQFIEKYPDVVDRAVGTGVGLRQFDVTLQRLILVREHNEQPHVHASVIHLNLEKQLRDDANPEPLAVLPEW